MAEEKKKAEYVFHLRLDEVNIGKTRNGDPQIVLTFMNKDGQGDPIRKWLYFTEKSKQWTKKEISQFLKDFGETSFDENDTISVEDLAQLIASTLADQKISLAIYRADVDENGEKAGFDRIYINKPQGAVIYSREDKLAYAKEAERQKEMDKKSDGKEEVVTASTDEIDLDEIPF